VNNAKVIFKDVDASNGVIHVIDHVLMPPTQNLVQLAQSNPDLSTLVAAVVQAGAVGLLESDGPFTVFAPTNMAFQNALAALGYSALVDVPNDALLNILAYHLIGARVFSYNLSDGLMPQTVQGGTVTISLNGGAKVKGNGNSTASNIVAVDILATNGVVHVIDQVLLP
ncbi:MAG TPA: fasciclin domain-containing protein, partial [Flavisolibacter sp.]|nr:fasciclin domain-containing protein [Flavisolibacter sp.]